MYTHEKWQSETHFPFGYVQYLPKDLDPKEKYPLVFFLHGAGERGEDLDVAVRHGFMKHVREEGAEYPFLCVAPQCPKGKYWGGFIESLLAFLDDIMEKLPVDPDRVYLTGLSMGATGTFLLAMAAPERFAALVPIAGSGICWYAGALKSIPVRMYHGDVDDIVPLQESVTMLRELNRRGGKAELIIYHGLGHSAWTPAYKEPDLVPWLLSQNRKNNAPVVPE